MNKTIPALVGVALLCTLSPEEFAAHQSRSRPQGVNLP
jgi:hypothetical protein